MRSKIIFLLIFLVLITGCVPSPVKPTADVNEQIAECSAKLYDKNVKGSEERQINTLKCFKELAQQNYSPNICLGLKSTIQIGCLIAFARVKNDLGVCEIGEGAVAIDDCIENAVQKSSDCDKLKKQENIENCLSRKPKGIEF